MEVVKLFAKVLDTDKLLIRCIPPKGMPINEQYSRGMTFEDKNGNKKTSVREGGLKVSTGKFEEKRGKGKKDFDDGYKYLSQLNEQGYGIYFKVHDDERFGDLLFHESDKLSIEEQQATINRITLELGKPAAIVKTRKSLHSYWKVNELLKIGDGEGCYADWQRRWLQYSECDDLSLSDSGQLMRLPGFDHVKWNPETKEIERVQCELLQANEVSYSLEVLDGLLPKLDTDLWIKNSLTAIEDSEPEPGDIRLFATYLDGYKENGRDGWDTCRCPSHNGESEDSLHVDRATGGFICHAGCKPEDVYRAARAKAVKNGYRFPYELGEDSKEITEILNLKNSKAPDIFSGILGILLKILANNFNIPVEIVNLGLLAILASGIDARTQLLVNPGTNYYVKAIRWIIIIGETGCKKTPVINALMKALREIQNVLKIEYDLAFKTYEKNLSKYKNNKSEGCSEPETIPAMREVYFDDFTIEAIAGYLSKHPNDGNIIVNDELAQFFNSMNSHRGGRGSDRQRWLTLYNGNGIKVNRKTEDTIFTHHSSISILGGIQPQTIKDLVNNDKNDLDGLWCRFSFINIPHSKTKAFTDIPDDINQVIKDVYVKLKSLPDATYRFSDGGKSEWEVWHDRIEDLTISESDPMAKGIYAKFEGVAARNALILHLVDAVTSNTPPSEYISGQTVKLACDWTQYELNQTLFNLRSHIETDDPEIARILKFIERFKDRDWISSRDVIHWWSPKPKPDAQKARKFMVKVVSMGYAIDNGESNNTSKYQIKILENSGNNGNKSPQTHTQQAKSLLPTVVTEASSESLKPSQDIVTSVVTTLDNKSSTESNTNGSLPSVDIVFSDFVTTADNKNSNSIKANSSNGYSESITNTVTNTVTHGGNSVKANSSNGSSQFVTTVTTNLKEKDWENSAYSGFTSISVDKNTTTNPRDVVTVAKVDGKDRMVVDSDRLDLNYQPSVPIPEWQPTIDIEPYENKRKCYLDIETTGLDPKVDRVIMVGLMDDVGNKAIVTSHDENDLLLEVRKRLNSGKYQCLIGHNLFNFDLPFLIERAKFHGMSFPFSKGSKEITITSSSVNGQPIQFTPICWKGVDILDTYQQVAIWDKQAAKLNSYSLKSSVITLGLREDRRLELSHDEINQHWDSGNLKAIKEYLGYDLDDTKLLADFLLPVVYYQLAYVPKLSFQNLATASPARKAQNIHEYLLPRSHPEADKTVAYDGGGVDLLLPGLHHKVAKIDVSSLYPSVMLRYGLCSRKDRNNEFLGVLSYMTKERLKLKALAKSGDLSASFQEKSLKILINGSYGFFGTGGYSFNDYQAAALVTAYGRKILDLMVSVVTSHGGKVIEIDTDGILFSHDDPESVKTSVAQALPEGITIDLELSNCGLYAPKAKNYIIIHPDGKPTVKGLFRKRNRYPLANEFPVEFLKLYFQDSPQAATEYYQLIRSQLETHDIDLEKLTITRKIAANEKKLIEAGLGEAGDKVSYWIGEEKRTHAKTGKPLASKKMETNSDPYWVEYYLKELDDVYQEIIGS